jgi:hypothetical protein
MSISQKSKPAAAAPVVQQTSWFEITAKDAQVRYGWGTRDEAQAFVNFLNRDSRYGTYRFTVLTDAEVETIPLVGPDARTDSFVIEKVLRLLKEARDMNDAWR